MINKFLQDIKKSFGNPALKPAILGVLLFYEAYFGAGFINSCRNNWYLRDVKNYNTLQEAEQDVKKEKEALGIENLVINLNVDNSPTRCQKNKDGSYTINFKPKRLNYPVLRHELYHIKKLQEGSLIRHIPLIGEYEEWKATSYAVKRAQEEAE